MITVGWLSGLLAFGFSPIFLGAIAICMGIVLRRDYGVAKHGLVLIILGIVGGIGGWVLNILLL